MRQERLPGGARLPLVVGKRVVVGLADDLQIVVGPVGAHLLQQVTELGDREDVGRDLVAKRRHSAIIRRICRTPIRLYTLCVCFGCAGDGGPYDEKPSSAAAEKGKVSQ